MPEFPNSAYIRPTFVSDTDPGSTQGAGVFWWRPTLRTLKVRNMTNTAWDDVTAGGLSGVSSLPAPGGASASTIYLLTTDDESYVLNGAGTALIPIRAPGFPRRDGANDTEWEMANADPPSGFAWASKQAGMSVDVNSIAKSQIIFAGSAASGLVATLYRSATFTTSGKTILGPFSLMASPTSSDTGWVGLAYRNSTSGRALSVTLRTLSNACYVSVHRVDTGAGSVVDVMQDNNDHPCITPLLLAIENDGVNLNCKIGPVENGREGIWNQIYTEALATYVDAAGGATDQYGITFRQNAAAPCRASNPWIRVI